MTTHPVRLYLDQAVWCADSNGVSIQHRKVGGALAVLGMAASVLAITGLIERAIGSAVCMEAAKYLLISCVAPPDALIWAAVGAFGLGCGVGLGMVIGVPTWLQTRQTSPVEGDGAARADRVTYADAE
jgi:hypothetical protein